MAHAPFHEAERENVKKMIEVAQAYRGDGETGGI
jgi:hypothetical protein